MLEGIFGSPITERTLLFLLKNKEAYPREMARILGLNLYRLQKNLGKLEDHGIVVSVLRGKIRLYQLNNRSPFIRELTALLEKSFSFLPQDERDVYLQRRRPRRPEKRT